MIPHLALSPNRKLLVILLALLLTLSTVQTPVHAQGTRRGTARPPSAGSDIDPNALSLDGGTMTGGITLDNDSTDVITLPTYPDHTTNSPSIRFNTQGMEAVPWRIFNHDGGAGFHDHVLTFAYNSTYNNTDGWVRDSSESHWVRMGLESRFVTVPPGDPSTQNGLFEFNIDVDPSLGTLRARARRPFGFGYDMDAGKMTMNFGVPAAEDPDNPGHADQNDPGDPNSGYYSFGTMANIWVNLDTLNIGDRTRAGGFPTDITTPGRIVIDPGFRASLGDKAVLIRNQFPSGHLHIMSGIDPTSGANGKILIGGGRRSDVVLGSWSSFQEAKLLVEGSHDIVQTRIIGNSTQNKPIFMVTDSANTPLAEVSNLGILTLRGGTEFTDDDTDITCSAGNYNISADLSETKLKACVNGVRGDIPASLSGSGTLNFSDPAADSCSTDLTITVTGAADGDVVSLGVPNGSVVAGGQFTAWVSADNTVTVRHCCVTGADCADPASGTFKARVDKS